MGLKEVRGQGRTNWAYLRDELFEENNNWGILPGLNYEEKKKLRGALIEDGVREKMTGDNFKWLENKRSGKAMRGWF